MTTITLANLLPRLDELRALPPHHPIHLIAEIKNCPVVIDIARIYGIFPTSDDASLGLAYRVCGMARGFKLPNGEARAIAAALVELVSPRRRHPLVSVRPHRPEHRFWFALQELEHIAIDDDHTDGAMAVTLELEHGSLHVHLPVAAGADDTFELLEDIQEAALGVGQHFIQIKHGVEWHRATWFNLRCLQMVNATTLPGVDEVMVNLVSHRTEETSNLAPELAAALLDSLARFSAKTPCPFERHYFDRALGFFITAEYLAGLELIPQSIPTTAFFIDDAGRPRRVAGPMSALMVLTTEGSDAVLGMPAARADQLYTALTGWLRAQPSPAPR